LKQKTHKISTPLAFAILMWQASNWVSRTCPECQATAITWPSGEELRIVAAVDTTRRIEFPIVCPTCGYTLWFDAIAAGVLIPDPEPPPPDARPLAA